MANANNAAANGSSDSYDVNVTVNSGSSTTGNLYDVTPETPTVINNEDGTHTEIEIVKETKNIDG